LGDSGQARQELQPHGEGATELKVGGVQPHQPPQSGGPDCRHPQSGFGTALRPGANLTGRQMEFGLKILF
jgi:hypothetical protein